MSQYIKRGMPERADGKLDREKALHWLAANQLGVIDADKGATRAHRIVKQQSKQRPMQAAALADDALDPLRERTRKDKELADRTALQNVVARGELVSVADAEATWLAIIGVARERLLALPNKLGPRLVGLRSASEAQAIIEDEVHAALSELADATVSPVEHASSAQEGEHPPEVEMAIRLAAEVGPIAARVAVQAGATVEAAFVLNTMVACELDTIACKLLGEQGYEGFDDLTVLELAGLGARDPDWDALARQADAEFDEAACEDLLEQTMFPPGWQPPVRSARHRKGGACG
ncbi:hypothetical protein [Methylobacterium crusticola]|uniref:hypothetical protein n=1 Tax=Methylobacterium crusticola TaxID=1697972 RepID=UPI001EE2AD5A|nr:hypothetical protein [Methylobacterium crusticola]